MLFDIRTIETGGWSIVSVVGDVDLATMPALSAGLGSCSAKRVALDISGVDHFDPLCFGVVIAGDLRVRRGGARFCVVCPPGRPRELFSETGLDRVIPIVASRDELDRAGADIPDHSE